MSHHRRLSSALAALALSASMLAPRSVVAQYCAPSPSAVVDRALAAAGVDSASDSRWARQARVAALLPEATRLEARTVQDGNLRVESRIDQDFDTELSSDGAELTDWHRSAAADRREARVIIQWRLSDLVWSSELLAIDRQRIARAAARRQLGEAVIELYFDWVEAAIAAMTEPAWRHDEQLLRAHLDLFTDGWFSTEARCTLPPIRAEASVP